MFKLPESFIDEFRHKKPDFGFNGLGEVVYTRTYSRVKKTGEKEEWLDTIRRVVEGVYDIIQSSRPRSQLSLEQTIEAMEMFRKMFHMKFLPPGRGLWAMGTDIVAKKGGAALNNCGFISTGIEDSLRDPDSFAEPFLFAMDMLMLGVGIGFDTRGAGCIKIRDASHDEKFEYTIEDSREGWVFSVGLLLDSYFDDLFSVKSRQTPVFDYSQIRPSGEPIKIFGGTASGPECLKQLHDRIRKILTPRAGSYISQKDIVDLFNVIGSCVVAGNVRRSAELAIGLPNKEFMELKDYKINPERAMWGWCSNNSVWVNEHSDFEAISKNVVKNGEPGFLWIDNMRKYGRMKDTPNFKDSKAMGGNPCLEQTLESGELCCLVEVFIARQRDLKDFMETLYYAYLYAKTVTMVPVHVETTRKIMERNRRIGISVTGIAQFLSNRTLMELQSWLDSGYHYLVTLDEQMSRRLGIPMSIKLTSVKPSGTVSLLAGSTPGMHYPISRFYYRRLRLGQNDESMVTMLRSKGFHIDPDPNNPSAWVATFAVDAGENIRTMETVGMWEQINLAVFLQRHWADNQVSCTVTFDPKTEASQIPVALGYLGCQLKAISFLPKGDDVYPLMPYQKITEKKYRKYMKNIQSFGRLSKKSLNITLNPDPSFEEDLEKNEYCDNETCNWVFKPRDLDDPNVLVIDDE